MTYYKYTYEKPNRNQKIETLKKKEIKLPEFELLFNSYQWLFYGLVKESHKTHREANFETELLLYPYPCP